MKKYTQREKNDYYGNKADVISKKYNKLFNNNRVMTYDSLIITRDNKAKSYCKKLIKSKEYDRDMYSLLYYSARAEGDNHKKAESFAKETLKSNFKYNNVVEIRDVANILKNHVKLEDE